MEKPDQVDSIEIGERDTSPNLNPPSVLETDNNIVIQSTAISIT